MKNIFNAKKAIVAVAAVATMTFSCQEDFLEVLPTGSLGESQLTSSAGVEGALIGTYGVLAAKGYSRLAAPNNWVFGSVMGGESNKGTDPGDYSAINPLQRYEGDPTAGDVSSSWAAKYEGISRANSTIRLATVSEAISDATRTRIIAEARFLRGHYYFELKKLFNNVPYIAEDVDYGSGIELVTNTGTDVWSKIEEDFTFADNNLPETQGEAGRVNKWAAKSYLGKAYLFQGKFSQAKSTFDAVIANGQTTNGKKYGLVSEFAQIFNAENDNHEESIFALQTSMNSGSTQNSNWFDDLNYPYNTGSDGPGNCCGFFQPSFYLANAYRTVDGLPMLNGFVGDGGELANDYGVESSDAFAEDAQPVDPRLDHTVGRRGIPYLDWIEHPGKDWIRSQPYAGPYSPKKFIYYRSQENTLTDGSSWTRGYATMNFNIIRFADVLLMAAEAEIEAGDMEKAREYVNMVRSRAANPTGMVMEYDGSAPAANYVINTYDDAWTDQAVARKAVRMERLLELAQEGHRFFDLVRWGIAAEELNGYLAFESQTLAVKFAGASFTAGKNEYLPIPQDQIDVQGTDVLSQNPGY